jgi:hypothetical protein
VLPPTSNGDRVPAEFEARFGFGFTLPRAGELVEVRFVRQFLAQGIRDPKTGERHLSEPSELRLAVGQKELFLGYAFQRAEELVPGVWMFDLWHRDAALLSKSFTVYRP